MYARIGLVITMVLIAGAVTGASQASAATGVQLSSVAPCTSLTAPTYRLQKPSASTSFLTASWSEAQTLGQTKGYTQWLGAGFTSAPRTAAGLVAIHRLSNPRTQDEVWLPAGIVRSRAISVYGYREMGIRFYARAAPADCAIPVYRYIGMGGLNRQVTSAADRAALTKAGWIYRGISFYGGNPAGNASVIDPRFAIAIMPDTQQEVWAPDTRFANRTTWLANQRTALDLRFVLHTGDVVNWGWLVPSQYAVASKAMLPLERAGVPYALTIGNHDTRAVGSNGVGREYGGSAYVYNPECPERLGASECNTNLLVRHTEEFNAVFNAGRYTAVGGAFEPGKVDNIYSTFTAGGKKWLVLTLELWQRTSVIDWARVVVASHPDYNVIIQTHSYLDAAGAISTSNGGYGANAPRVLFDRLVKVYPNIKMVFSGHTGAAVSRTDTGVGGNKIASFLQAFHSNTTNPVRLMTIDTFTGTLTTRIYAPYTNQSLTQYNATVTGMRFDG